MAIVLLVGDDQRQRKLLSVNVCLRYFVSMSVITYETAVLMLTGLYMVAADLIVAAGLATGPLIWARSSPSFMD